MPNVDRSTPQEIFKRSDLDIEGLESFDDEPPSERTKSSVSPPPVALPQRPAQREPTSRPVSRRKSQRRSFSVFWPVVLVMAGALLLLENLGYLSGLSWGTVWRLWPLLLIALGIDTLFSRRSALGALFSALLILALLGGAVYFVINASSLPWASKWFEESGWQSEAIVHPLSGAERAKVFIDWASLPLRLEALADSPNLIEGTVVYRGRLNFDVSGGRRAAVRLSTSSMGAGWSPGVWTESADLEEREGRWVLGLSPRVPIDLELDGGSGMAEIDLRGLDLETFRLDVASGAVDLYLPAGQYETQIEGGSGSLDLWLPPEAGVRLEVEGGSGALRPGERYRLVEGERDGDGVWESDNWRQADVSLRMYINVGSGAVRVRDWQ